MTEFMNQGSADIHIATDNEIDLLPAIEAAADSVFAEIGIDDLPPAASADELRNAKALIVDGHPPIGFARVEELEGNAHLEQLSVLPEHAGRGAGGKLLEKACQWAAQQGYSAITLSTYKDVKWNCPFYKKQVLRS